MADLTSWKIRRGVGSWGPWHLTHDNEVTVCKTKIPKNPFGIWWWSEMPQYDKDMVIKRMQTHKTRHGCKNCHVDLDEWYKNEQGE